MNDEFNKKKQVEKAVVTIGCGTEEQRAEAWKLYRKLRPIVHPAPSRRNDQTENEEKENE